MVLGLDTEVLEDRVGPEALHMILEKCQYSGVAQIGVAATHTQFST